MKSNVLTVMKKEFARFFGDKRMIMTALILPGAMIYVMYSFMGSAISKMNSVDKTHISLVYVINLPESVRQMDETSKINFEKIRYDEVGGVKEKISAKEADLCMVFPENFDAAAAAYSVESAGKAPNIEIYYNSASNESNRAYMGMTALLSTYESALANKFDINRDVYMADIANEKDASGHIFASMLPMLLIIFLFSGCMAIAPESIAGEKERGTIATLLVTPMKRSELAIGKVLSLGCLAFLCGMSSTIGTFLSLPKLMGGAADDMNMNIYGATDYASLFFVIISTILLIITLISIISAFAKTVKEATMAIMPFMIVVVLIGVTAMFGSGAKAEWYYYLIPLYNSVQCMSGIFSFDYSAANLVIALISNVAVALAGGFVLTRMFNSEKIMFSK